MAIKNYVLVCGGTACLSAKSDAIYRGFLLECEERGIKTDVEVVKTGCFGFCEKGPIVKILPDDAFYVGVTPEDVKEIVAEHLVKGRPVQRLLYDWKDSKRQARIEEIDFYQKQFRIVLRNCGVIDPDSIEEYIARDGYVALEKALFEMTPDQVIDELKRSGLRGRGGAGFPTWLKWKLTKDVSSDVRKYVVCNADEGDPGAYMDRSTLEGDPHSILEAMTICGRTVGAAHGYIYIRAEYPLAIQRLETAIAQAREMGLLGKDILGSGFDFDIELRLGAGAFVCGEETALLTSIEGNRGHAGAAAALPLRAGPLGQADGDQQRRDLGQRPRDPHARAPTGSRRSAPTKSKGTKVFALTGKIANSGLVEVPMGTTLREIIFDVGGGIRERQGVQGGPDGRPFGRRHHEGPPRHAHRLRAPAATRLDHGLRRHDRHGRGRLHGGHRQVLPRLYRRRELRQVRPLQDRRPVAAEGPWKRSARAREHSRISRRCGPSATQCSGPACAASARPRRTRSSRPCATSRTSTSRTSTSAAARAHKCKSLVIYAINADKCIGCTLCARRCPVSAITGERRKPHTIDGAVCIKCGECYSVCKFDAVEVR